MNETQLPELGLSMIVKNEAHVIERCLESISPFIQYWVICDTGSTDNTKEIIQNFFAKKKIPGEIIDIPWEGFGKSRSNALELCRGKMKYAWMIDADDSVAGTPNIPRPLVHDGYGLKIKRGDFTWFRNHIFKVDSGWFYEGILHEYANCKKAPFSAPRLEGNYHIEARTEGGRNVNVTPKEKYLKDAEILIDALTNESSPHYTPNNSRYVFYLAQSYFDAGDYEQSKNWYLRRVQLGGWEEEVFYSMYRVGICCCLNNAPWSECMDAFLQAWAYRPGRAEPLWQLSRLYRNNGNPRLAYIFAKSALDIPFPENDILFLSHDLWDWSLLDEIGATAYYVNRFEEGLAACDIMLRQGKCPKEHLERVQNNIVTYKNAISKRDGSIAEMVAKRAEMLKEAGIEVPVSIQKNVPLKTFKKRKSNA